MRSFVALCLLFVSSLAFAGNCTKAAAYAAGFNDEQAGRPMQQNYAQVCLGGDTDMLNYNYIKGYKAAARINNGGYPYNPNPPPQQCVNTFGSKVCGYNCVSTGTSAQCAKTPDQSCVKDSMGDIACGYGCASNSFKAQCASGPNESCVSDSFGSITCGKNCRIEYGKGVCDS
jgi:hypothetical protein